MEEKLTKKHLLNNYSTFGKWEESECLDENGNPFVTNFTKENFTYPDVEVEIEYDEEFGHRIKFATFLLYEDEYYVLTKTNGIQKTTDDIVKHIIAFEAFVLSMKNEITETKIKQENEKCKSKNK